MTVDFKKYPDNEPNKKGVSYLTITDMQGVYTYSITLFNNDSEWDTEYETVEAFVDVDPSSVYANSNWLSKMEYASERYIEAEKMIIKIIDMPWYMRIFCRSKLLRFLKSRKKYNF